MNTRILLVSGVLALAIIAAVLVLAVMPDRSHETAAARSAFATASPAPSAKPTSLATLTPSEPAAITTDTPFIIKRILPIKGPIKYGEWHWDEAGIPDGPLVITVDLDARVLSVFRGGYEIGATAVLLGSQEKPTPTGIFPITEKDIDHRSNIYDGAPMPFMQRLTNDGVSLHGSKVEKGYASHGCIGMPDPFAAKLFQMTQVGDKVYITRGKKVGIGDSLVGG